MEEMIQAQATAMRTACARMTTLDPPRRDRHALMDFLASKLIRRKSQHVWPSEAASKRRQEDEEA
jgi:hypothetical protein